MLNRTKRIGIYDGLLLVVAMIWGSSFTVTQYAIDANMSPALIVALRFSVASLVLFFAGWKKIGRMNKSEWKLGIISGIILAVGFLFQTIGLSITTPSNNAFLTSTNVIMVPFICWIIYKKRPPACSFGFALLCLAGIFLLTFSPQIGWDFSMGDALSLMCAAAFGGHIVYLDMAAKEMDSSILCFAQVVATAVVCWLFVVIVEPNSLTAAEWKSGFLPIIYLGVVCTSICFFLQVLAQSHNDATRTSIILSTEGVFGAVFSVALGIEVLRWNMVAGGIIIFLSVILAEITGHEDEHIET